MRFVPMQVRFKETDMLLAKTHIIEDGVPGAGGK